MDKIKFAIPKGSLEKATAEFFSKSGFKIGGTERTYRPSINDPQIELKVLDPKKSPFLSAKAYRTSASQAKIG